MGAMDPAVIDLSILAGVIGDDPAKLHRFAHKFVDTTRAALAELHACLAGADIARMRELGHRVKSSARIVGALGMGELCEQLEKLPVQDPQAELGQARALVERMDPLLERIVTTISTLATPPAP
jgi:HPt (histidine-containing phosphotransfer) domain-containing protein